MKINPKYSTSVSSVTLEMTTDEFLMLAGCLGSMRHDCLSGSLYQDVTKARESMGLKRKYEGRYDLPQRTPYLKEIE